MCESNYKKLYYNLLQRYTIVKDWYLKTLENYDGMMTRKDLEVDFDRRLLEALEEK